MTGFVFLLTETGPARKYSVKHEWTVREKVTEQKSSSYAVGSPGYIVYFNFLIATCCIANVKKLGERRLPAYHCHCSRQICIKSLLMCQEQPSRLRTVWCCTAWCCNRKCNTEGWLPVKLTCIEQLQLNTLHSRPCKTTDCYNTF